MSSRRVCSFAGSAVINSSFAVRSQNTIRRKMHIGAVSITSVDSSSCSKKHSQFSISFRTRWVKSLTTASQRRVASCLDSCRALVDDNIPALFLKSLNSELAASRNASFTISPSWKDLFHFNDDVTHFERCI